MTVRWTKVSLNKNGGGEGGLGKGPFGASSARNVPAMYCFVEQERLAPRREIRSCGPMG